MNVSYELEEVGVLLTEERFIAVLKQVAMSSVTSIISYSITGQEPPHESGQWRGTSAQQKMHMVGQERKSKATCPSGEEKVSQPCKEVVVILLILEYLLALNTAHNDVMNSGRCIDAALSGHTGLSA